MRVNSLLVVAGVAAGIYSLTRMIRQNNMSEEDARARVCEEALKSMHNYSKSYVDRDEAAQLLSKNFPVVCRSFWSIVCSAQLFTH